MKPRIATNWENICLNQVIFLVAIVAIVVGFAQRDLHAQTSSETDYQTQTDLPYYTGDGLTEYQQQRCRLDLYYPTEKQGFATVVWFHGGGLTAGKKSIPETLKGQGIAVVAVNYRLSPQVKGSVCIEDAAAAVAWTFQNIVRFGGSSSKIYVSGHSAGGYLTSMVGLDPRWLKPHGITRNAIAGLIPFSGHTITHFTIRKERGIDGKQPIIDDLAPLFHVTAHAPPLLLITGDRELELLARYEENAYMWRMMQVAGHQQTQLLELDGFDHSGMAKPAHLLLLKFIAAQERKRNPNQ